MLGGEGLVLAMEIAIGNTCEAKARPRGWVWERVAMAAGSSWHGVSRNVCCAPTYTYNSRRSDGYAKTQPSIYLSNGYIGKGGRQPRACCACVHRKRQ